MDIETLRNLCLSKKGATEDMPFGDSSLVFKVMNKIFVLADIGSPELCINVKCDPGRAIELREQYADIIPGYHMNKKHWNTIYCERELGDAQITELMEHSYRLVIQTLKKNERDALNEWV